MIYFFILRIRFSVELASRHLFRFAPYQIRLIVVLLSLTSASHLKKKKNFHLSPPSPSRLPHDLTKDSILPTNLEKKPYTLR